MFEGDDDSWSYLDWAVDCGRLKAAKLVFVVFELFEKGEKFQLRGNGSSGDGVTRKINEMYIDKITKLQPINRVRSPTNQMTHHRVTDVFRHPHENLHHLLSCIRVYISDASKGGTYV